MSFGQKASRFALRHGPFLIHHAVISEHVVFIPAPWFTTKPHLGLKPLSPGINLIDCHFRGQLAGPNHSMHQTLALRAIAGDFES